MVYIYTMEYYSALKKENSIIYNEIDECRRHYSKWNKPITKR
jgi:hypothetical protein